MCLSNPEDPFFPKYLLTPRGETWKQIVWNFCKTFISSFKYLILYKYIYMWNQMFINEKPFIIILMYIYYFM